MHWFRPMISGTLSAPRSGDCWLTHFDRESIRHMFWTSAENKNYGVCFKHPFQHRANYRVQVWLCPGRCWLMHIKGLNSLTTATLSQSERCVCVCEFCTSELDQDTWNDPRCAIFHGTFVCSSFAKPSLFLCVSVYLGPSNSIKTYWKIVLKLGFSQRHTAFTSKSNLSGCGQKFDRNDHFSYAFLSSSDHWIWSVNVLKTGLTLGFSQQHTAFRSRSIISWKQSTIEGSEQVLFLCVIAPGTIEFEKTKCSRTGFLLICLPLGLP